MARYDDYYPKSRRKRDSTSYRSHEIPRYRGRSPSVEDQSGEEDLVFRSRRRKGRQDDTDYVRPHRRYFDYRRSRRRSTSGEGYRELQRTSLSRESTGVKILGKRYLDKDAEPLVVLVSRSPSPSDSERGHHFASKKPRVERKREKADASDSYSSYDDYYEPENIDNASHIETRAARVRAEPQLAQVYVVREDGMVQRAPSPSQDMNAFDEFDFICNGEDSTKIESHSDAEASVSDLFSIPDEAEASWTSPVTSVHSSHYVGDAEIGGIHKASLAVKHGLKGRNQSLFKWLHVQQDVMNFDEFWVEITRQLHLNEMDRNAVARLRARVKLQSVSSIYNAKGQKVGYMEPEVVEVPLQKPKHDQSDEDELSEAALKWICIPYFNLQQYSGLLAGSSIASFPNQTLLQLQYSRISEQRDMEQAVAQLGIAPKGHVFHTSQLWCLVLDNRILVTCGQMNKTDLQGETLDFTSELSASTSPDSYQIFVKYGDAVLWTLPLSECTTWFGFISHFHSFWPTAMEFEHHGKPVKPQDWPKILKFVNKAHRVTLELKTTDTIESPSRTDLRDEIAAIEQPSAGSQSKQSENTRASSSNLKAPDSGKATHNEPFHVFHLLSSASTESSPAINVKGLDEQLQSVEDYLTSAQDLSFFTKTNYKECKTSTRKDLITLLARQKAEMEAKQDDEERQQYEKRIELASTLEAIYELFLPLNYEGPTSTKFWGALVSIFTQSDMTEASRLQSILGSSLEEINLFQSIMSFANPEDRAKVEYPRQFTGAWLRILSGLVSCAERPRRESFIDAKARISVGMAILIKSISSANLLDNAVVLPMELVSLLALQLLQDQVNQGDDILSTYSMFLNSVLIDITSRPSDRSNQQKLELVIPEMRAIMQTLQKQRQVISTLRRNYKDREDRGQDRLTNPALTRDYKLRVTLEKSEMTEHVEDVESASKLSPKDKSGFRRLFLTDCARLIELRHTEFFRLRDYSKALEKDINYEIEATKDRQENAVYAFTAVSYLFLPMSAIAGIFGMNTSDVRDMKYRQWLYWSVAIPVTACVIFIALWWTGELKNLISWVKSESQPRKQALTEKDAAKLASRRRNSFSDDSSDNHGLMQYLHTDRRQSYDLRRRYTGRSRR